MPNHTKRSHVRREELRRAVESWRKLGGKLGNDATAADVARYVRMRYAQMASAREIQAELKNKFNLSAELATAIVQMMHAVIMDQGDTTYRETAAMLRTAYQRQLEQMDQLFEDTEDKQVKMRVVSSRNTTLKDMARLFLPNAEEGPEAWMDADVMRELWALEGRQDPVSGIVYGESDDTGSVVTDPHSHRERSDRIPARGTADPDVHSENSHQHSGCNTTESHRNNTIECIDSVDKSGWISKRSQDGIEGTSEIEAQFDKLMSEADALESGSNHQSSRDEGLPRGERGAQMAGKGRSTVEEPQAGGRDLRRPGTGSPDEGDNGEAEEPSEALSEFLRLLED